MKYTFQTVECEPDPLKGMLAGAIGGLAGSLAMNIFHVAVDKMQEMQEERRQERDWTSLAEDTADEFWTEESFPTEHQYGEEQDESNAPPPLSRDNAGEPATVKAAEAVTEKVTGHGLSYRARQLANPIVHYSFGTSLGMLYGMGAEYMPALYMAGGAPFGAAVMLATEETTVPALQLTRPPKHHSKIMHLYSLISHIIFGVTTEAVRRQVRRMLE